MEYDDLKQILKVMDKNAKSESDEQFDTNFDICGWVSIPENVLVRIFKLIAVKDILSCSETCRRWNFISNDSQLWKFKTQNDFKINKKIPRKPGERIVLFSSQITSPIRMIQYESDAN